MDGFLDGELLEGAHEAVIRYRPIREAIPFNLSQQQYYDLIEHESQIWGGATTPLIPVDEDGNISSLYTDQLAGAAIDHVAGIDYFGIYKKPLPPVTGSGQRRTHQVQLALGMFSYGEQDSQRRVEVTTTRSSDDPWRGIYAACLGLLPEKPNPQLLAEGYFLEHLKFEDFIHVDRVAVEGSFDDLVERLSNERSLSPRRMSMINLSYGNAGSSSIRSGRTVLPSPHFKKFDAGPNILVVCSPDDYNDLALLWNLRAASGDFRPVPIGIPVEDFSAARAVSLCYNPRIARNGVSATSLYITSVSISTARLTELLGDRQTAERRAREYAVVAVEEVLSFGDPGGLVRNEILVWKEGITRFVPTPTGSHEDVLGADGINESARMQVDVSIPESPFPSCTDVRLPTMNGDFYGGVYSRWETLRVRSGVKEVVWPSRLLMAEAVANARGIWLRESEPGRAGRLAVDGLHHIHLVANLQHAPLLELLESMAARQGFGWYKVRLRERGIETSPIQNVGPSTDDLPSRTFGDFQRALGRNQKAAQNWLYWAERSRLLIKGFELECPSCGGRQWIPVAAFTPPISCRGCAEEIDPPFGNKSNISFKYRLSERLRRVYEQDGMGHLLATYYFYCLFGHARGSELIGLLPGMEIGESGGSAVVGEADVLLFTRQGDFVPVEVKRTSTGLTESEVEKLERICSVFRSPWSAVATCQYASVVDESYLANVSYWLDGTYRRIALTYEQLLNPRVVWALGSDPFAWQPMTDEEVEQREQEFVTKFQTDAEFDPSSWMRHEMLRRPGEYLEADETP